MRGFLFNFPDQRQLVQRFLPQCLKCLSWLMQFDFVCINP